MHVLIAYDASPVADAAVRATATLFPDAEATVLAVHDPVMGPETATRVGGGLMSPEVVKRTLDELAREHVEDAQRTADAGARVATDAGLAVASASVVGAGQAWRAILSAAAELEAEVVVCGSRGQGAVGRVVLGSTSSSVLHHADRPVLVVPESETPPAGPSLIGYDGSPAARRAVAETARLLPERPAVVVHAWESPLRHSAAGRALAGAPLAELREMSADLESWLREAAEATAAEGAELARDGGLDAAAEPVESGTSVWRALTATAERHDAAVVVVGAQGRGRASSVLLGSVSAGLVHHAERPVLVIRPPAE